MKAGQLQSRNKRLSSTAGFVQLPAQPTPGPNSVGWGFDLLRDAQELLPSLRPSNSRPRLRNIAGGVTLVEPSQSLKIEAHRVYP